jgi:hypothetical protein
MSKPSSGNVTKAEQRWAEATKRDKQARKAIQEVAVHRTEKIARLRALRASKEEADRVAAEREAEAKARLKQVAEAVKKRPRAT